MELGSGDCHLSFKVSKEVKKVYAVDVSEYIAKSSSSPKNFKLIISDGSSIDVSENSVDVAYSYQLMEHLHPGDAIEQLRSIYKALTVGGVYICVTPNRLNGPHDISKYFDEVARGFHLKEYTTTELTSIFKEAGFSKVFLLFGAKGFVIPFPAFPIRLIEYGLIKLPYTLREKISCWLPMRLLLAIKLVAIK